MDPISLIVAALVAGAVASAKDVAGDAIKDSYAALKELLKRRFSKAADQDSADEKSEAPAGVDPNVVLEAHASSPETWDLPVREALKASGAAHDSEILAAAQALLDAADGAGGQSGKYRVDARGAQGVQVGDRGQMTNTFGAIAPSGQPPPVE